DFEQVDQCLDPFGRFEEQRPDRQRRLPLMMGLFDVALLLELGEERVGTARQGRRRQQRGIAIVVGVGLGGGFVVMENEAQCRPATTARLCRMTAGATVLCMSAAARTGSTRSSISAKPTTAARTTARGPRKSSAWGWKPFMLTPSALAAKLPSIASSSWASWRGGCDDRTD